jgi:hypothetical protein
MNRLSKRLRFWIRRLRDNLASFIATKALVLASKIRGK